MTRQRASNPAVSKPYSKEAETHATSPNVTNLPPDEYHEQQTLTFAQHVKQLQIQEFSQSAPYSSQNQPRTVTQTAARHKPIPKTIRPKRQRPQLRLVDFQPSLLFNYGDLCSSSETEAKDELLPLQSRITPFRPSNLTATPQFNPIFSPSPPTNPQSSSNSKYFPYLDKTKREIDANEFDYK